MKLPKFLPLLGIVMVFAVVGFFLLNPAERSKQTRDQQRVTDLQELKKALDFFLTKNAKISSDTEKLLCTDCDLTKDVFSYRSIEIDSLTTKERHGRFVNGTGWIPIDFSANMKLGETPLKLLPVDPLEKGYNIRKTFPVVNLFFSNNEGFVYTFTPGKSGKYKLTAKMESKTGLEKAKDDGGTLDDRLEIGSDLSLRPSYK